MPEARTWVGPGGVPVRLFGSAPGRRGDYAFALGVVRTLWTGRRRFGFVYFVMPGIHVLLGVAFARVLGIRIIMKFSGSDTIRALTRSFVGRLETRVIRRWADRILLLNPGMVEEALESGFDRYRLLWMPNPVDMDEFAPCDHEQRRRLRAELRLPPDKLTVVYTGRLAQEKELYTLLKAFRLVIDHIPESLLVMVGDGPERPHLERQIRELDLGGSVRIVGAVTPTTVRCWLQVSDAFVLTSSLEGLPLSLIEAMAVGLTVIVSDIPGTRQLVAHETTGLVTPLRDEKALSSAIIRVFADADLRARLGTAARREAAARFSMEVVVAAYEKLFADLVA